MKFSRIKKYPTAQIGCKIGGTNTCFVSRTEAFWTAVDIHKIHLSIINPLELTPMCAMQLLDSDGMQQLIQPAASLRMI